MFSKQVVIMAFIGQISAVQLRDSQKSKGEEQPGEWWSQIQSLAKQKKDTDNMLIQLDDDVLVQKYSDDLANGDRDDNREIDRDNDVDYNGHTNRGYGSRKPSEYFAGNHIFPGHRITVPRDDSGLGNNVRAQ